MLANEKHSSLLCQIVNLLACKFDRIGSGWLKNRFSLSQPSKTFYGRILWSNAFFSLKLIVEGTTEKVSKFKMPLMATYIKMFCLNEQKCIFEHHRKIKRMKISL